METVHWVETARDCDYMTDEEELSLKRMLDEIGRMLNSMMAKSNQFCRSDALSVREESVTYAISSEFFLHTDN